MAILELKLLIFTPSLNTSLYKEPISPDASSVRMFCSKNPEGSNVS